MCHYPIFETLSIINGVVQNIEYHQTRYEYTLKHYFHKTPNIQLKEIIKLPKEYIHQQIRCRINYNSEEFEIHYYPYTPRKVNSFQAVYVENLDYQFKYVDRTILNNLKTDNADEIIIINNGFVSDCTIGNLLFLKENQWYSSTHYLLKGTQLSYLVDQYKVKLIEIRAVQLPQFEKVMMINALNPFDEQRAIPIQSVRL